MNNSHPVSVLHTELAVWFSKALLKRELSNDRKFSHVASGKKFVICRIMKI